MLERTGGERTYGQYCPVAAGLDLIGDRWVLLICRELVGGPAGFNQIKRALPGLASNLLSSRLRMMCANGLAERGDDGYELTAEGRSVIPVLRAVARFGVAALDGEPPQSFDAVRVARGFLLPWTSVRQLIDPVVIHAQDGTYAELVVNADDLQVRAVQAPDSVAGAVHLHVDAGNLVEVRQGSAPFSGVAEGPAEASERVLRALGLEQNEAVV